MRTLPSIKLEDFEGPFDLLIELARTKKLDLSKVSLAKITDEFLEHLTQQSKNQELYADFMVVAATLLLIKIKHLLPDITEEEEREITELTDRLWIYELYRRQALQIQDEWNKVKMLPAGYREEEKRNEANPLHWPILESTELELLMRQIIAKIPPPYHPRAHLKTRGWSLQECTRLFYDRLERMKECLFHDVVQGASKQDIAISFLAVLEMSRTQDITLHQNSFNDSILIKKYHE